MTAEAPPAAATVGYQFPLVHDVLRRRASVPMAMVPYSTVTADAESWAAPFQARPMPTTCSSAGFHLVHAAGLLSDGPLVE